MVEQFTGDHKLSNFKEKFQTTERNKLKLSDYLMATTQAQDSKKTVLQNQIMTPMLEDDVHAILERHSKIKEVNRGVKV